MDSRLFIKAFEISQTVDLRQLISNLGKHYPLVWTDPLMFALNAPRHEYLIVTRYGVIALVNHTPEFQLKVLSLLKPFLVHPVTRVKYSDKTRVVVEPGSRIQVHFNRVVLPKLDEQSALVIGMILCQSVGLESYEKRVDPLIKLFSREFVELQGSRFSFSTRRLTQSVNRIMLLRQELITNLGVLDKPDLTWNDPNLNYLYNTFSDHFEIQDRAEILSEKFKMLEGNVKTVLDMVNNYRAQFLELAIIALFVLEIVLFVYEVFVK